jgi:hypothetical protein
MTTLWGTLESSVHLAISKFAGYEAILDYRALIMVANSNFQQKIDIVAALCEQLVPEYPRLQEYKAVIAKLQTAQKARNKFAHNAIVTNEETGEVGLSYASARGGSLKTTIETVKLEAIKDATGKIHEAMCALHTLVTGRELKPIWSR